MEMLFLFCFSLHNLEEALWLPGWSKYAKRYHKEVTENEFRFAVIVITAIGYLITFQYMLFPSIAVSRFIYSGFVLMMVVNVVFPHLAATILLRRYAPGTVTGVLLNAPVGVYILSKEINSISGLIGVITAGGILSVIIIVMLKYLFAAGSRFIR